MWPTDPSEKIFMNLRLRLALKRFPGILLTSNQKIVEEYVTAGADNFKQTGHFLCPFKTLKEIFESPKNLGDFECPCNAAIDECKSNLRSSCGLMERSNAYSKKNSSGK